MVRRRRDGPRRSLRHLQQRTRSPEPKRGERVLVGCTASKAAAKGHVTHVAAARSPTARTSKCRRCDYRAMKAQPRPSCQQQPAGAQTRACPSLHHAIRHSTLVAAPTLSSVGPDTTAVAHMRRTPVRSHPRQQRDVTSRHPTTRGGARHDSHSGCICYTLELSGSSSCGRPDAGAVYLILR